VLAECREELGMSAAENLSGRPVVSVLIDTFNYGHFIEEAIRSVLVQDFPAEQMEIIVVDDGSTDDTRELVARYGERVQYFYKPNGGQASAFNYGIERARGEFIALLDADDYWLPSKLSKVVDAFQNGQGVALVYHRFQEFRMESYEWSVGEFNAVSGDVPQDLCSILLYTACQTSGLTFRASLVRKLLPLDERMTIQADGLLAALIIFLGPVVAIDEPLAVYRIHGANLYFHGAKGVDPARQARRVETLKVIVEEMDKWLTAQGYDLQQPEILAFRRRWEALYDTEEFALRPPGRVRFFKHLRRATKNMGPCLNRRIRTVNWVNTMASLIVGYHRYGDLDRWRIDLKRKLLE
jgi:glycosyltransferase involved in cell wall biosynthesis